MKFGTRAPRLFFLRAYLVLSHDWRYIFLDGIWAREYELIAALLLFNRSWTSAELDLIGVFFQPILSRYDAFFFVLSTE